MLADAASEISTDPDVDNVAPLARPSVEHVEGRVGWQVAYERESRNTGHVRRRLENIGSERRENSALPLGRQIYRCSVASESHFLD